MTVWLMSRKVLYGDFESSHWVPVSIFASEVDARIARSEADAKGYSEYWVEPYEVVPSA